MQNEYKGKRKSGAWIYGSLLYLKGLPYIIPDDGDLSKLDEYRVIDDTICQHTGLYNCGEEDIWEHDLVEFEGNIYEVRKEYDCPGGIWAHSGFILDRCGWAGFMDFEDTIYDYTNEIGVEIVGNVFDHNSDELIKKAKEKEEKRAAAEKEFYDAIERYERVYAQSKEEYKKKKEQ